MKRKRAEPTDKQMLDWMFAHAINAFRVGYAVKHKNHIEWVTEYVVTKAAIRAAMRKEKHR